MKPTERQRIEKEAIDYSDTVKPLSIRMHHEHGYIAGAIAEHDKARNQAIDDCIQAVLEYQNIIFEGKNFAQKLESLKTKP